MDTTSGLTDVLTGRFNDESPGSLKAKDFNAGSGVNNAMSELQLMNVTAKSIRTISFFNGFSVQGMSTAVSKYHRI
jgi:hypothetical protein